MSFLSSANPRRLNPNTSFRRIFRRNGKLRSQKLDAGFKRWKLWSASGASISPSDDEEEPPTPQVFPRIRKRDPYRLLGLSTDATLEEIQDARNYYYETHRHHGPSGEGIELASDAVLAEHIQK